MVLYIYKQNEDGGRNVIFDIEFYLKDDNFQDGRLWYSELHVVTMVKNLLKLNNGALSYPAKDENGDFEFKGELYSMKYMQVGGEEDEKLCV
jgi:hypothetical protein